MSEFDLIQRYFTWDNSQDSSTNPSVDESISHIVKSVGDDAAVLSLGTNKHIVTSIDTLISGVHFPETTSAYDIGHKSLAVNLSDLAAMGAKPEWFTLALTLPKVDHQWLEAFSSGLKALAEQTGIALVGGDTTRGPLAISIQVIGSVDKGKAIYRSGAKIGDKIYVTGTLGDARAGLLSIFNELSINTMTDTEYCHNRLNRPTARLKESRLIQSFASTCIDVSDGLLQDLSHILEQSNLSKNCDAGELGAEINLNNLPLSSALKELDADQAIDFALSGGDDYELLFTIPPSLESAFIQSTAQYSECAFSCIGEIRNSKGIVDNHQKPLNQEGFNHFVKRL